MATVTQSVWFVNAGLIQLRNEMAHYIRSSSQKSAAIDSDRCDWPFGRLPQPINNEKICEGCPQLLACMVYQRSVVFFRVSRLEWVMLIACFGSSSCTITILAFVWPTISVFIKAWAWSSKAPVYCFCCDCCCHYHWFRSGASWGMGRVFSCVC